MWLSNALSWDMGTYSTLESLFVNSGPSAENYSANDPLKLSWFVYHLYSEYWRSEIHILGRYLGRIGILHSTQARIIPARWPMISVIASIS